MPHGPPFLHPSIAEHLWWFTVPHGPPFIPSIAGHLQWFTVPHGPPFLRPSIAEHLRWFTVPHWFPLPPIHRWAPTMVHIASWTPLPPPIHCWAPTVVHVASWFPLLPTLSGNTNTNIFIFHRFLKQITLADSYLSLVIYGITLKSDSSSVIRLDWLIFMKTFTLLREGSNYELRRLITLGFCNCKSTMNATNIKQAISVLLYQSLHTLQINVQII